MLWNHKSYITSLFSTATEEEVEEEEEEGPTNVPVMMMIMMMMKPSTVYRDVYRRNCFFALFIPNLSDRWNWGSQDDFRRYLLFSWFGIPWSSKKYIAWIRYANVSEKVRQNSSSSGWSNGDRSRSVNFSRRRNFTKFIKPFFWLGPVLLRHTADGTCRRTGR